MPRCRLRHAICLHLGVFLWGYEFEAIKAHIRMAISALSLFWGCQLMGRKHEVNNSDLWLSLSQCYRPVHKSGARAHETIRYHKESKNVHTRFENLEYKSPKKNFKDISRRKSWFSELLQRFTKSYVCNWRSGVGTFFNFVQSSKLCFD